MVFRFVQEMTKTHLVRTGKQIKWFLAMKKRSFTHHFLHIVMFFSKPLPGTVFTGSWCRSLLKSLILVPFSIFWVFETITFEDHFGPQRLQRSSTPVEGERPFRDPAFHEAIVITVPLGHRVFFLSTFFRWRLAHSLFLLRFVVLCFIQHVDH